MDYHLPVVLIKSAMTIDMLSEGRLEFGIGAGWISEEYKAVGIKWDEPKIRIDRMGDVVQGIKTFCGEGPADIKQQHTQVVWVLGRSKAFTEASNYDRWWFSKGSEISRERGRHSIT